MVIDRNRWVRGLLVAQPAIVWPCSWVFWLGGSASGLVIAVVLLWVSALTCVFAIVAPVRKQEDTVLRQR